MQRAQGWGNLHCWNQSAKLHYMNQSATAAHEAEPLGARERRRQDTYAALTSHARTLTADRGLNGFTVEELCEVVGVSRRTFFNYFATKEDAILGAKPADPLEPFAESFLASGPAAAAAGSGTEPGTREPIPLKDALLTLILQGFSTLEVPRAHIHEFMAIMKAEPALMKRMIESARQRQRVLADLIARREGVPAGDPFAEAASALASHLMMSTFEKFFGHPHDGEHPVGEHPTDEPQPASAVDPDETPAEAQARFAAILTETFDHATRFFRA